MQKAVSIILIIIAIGAIVWFGVTQMRTSPEVATKPVVGATISALAQITTAVAGDAVEVVQIIPAGANPHTFEVTPSIIRDIQHATAVFAIGHGVDDWTSELASATGANVTTVDIGVTFEPLVFGDEDEPDEAPGSPDPHYWLGPENGKKIAAAVALTLSRLYPDHATTFEQNLTEFNTEVDAAVAQAHALLDPLTNRSLVLFHESFNYFTNTFNLTVAGVFEPSPGKEPTPQELAALQQTVKDNNVKAVFSEPQLPDTVVQAFIQDLDVKTGVIDPGEASLTAISYPDLLVHNAQAIHDALQ